MFSYIIKRILLMIPTMVAICLLIFLLLNLAPGNPGAKQVGSEGGQQADKGKERESYRLFKEQFNLDKPVLFNTRYNLKTSEVEDKLVIILNANKAYAPAQLIEAQNTIEDWGRYAVPGLIELIQKKDLAISAIASQRLTINAKKRLVAQSDANPTEKSKQKNIEISNHNERIKDKYFPDEQGDIIRFWNGYIETEEARFDSTKYPSIEEVTQTLQNINAKTNNKNNAKTDNGEQDPVITLVNLLNDSKETDGWDENHIPVLVEILNTSTDDKIKSLASLQLVTTAIMPPPPKEDNANPEEQKQKEEKVAQHNAKIKDKSFVVTTEKAKQKEEVINFWVEYGNENAGDWDYTFDKKMKILFLDTRFAKYVSNIAKLDFGKSHMSRKPVMDEIWKKLRYSITLALISILIAYGISLPLGIWSAVNQNSKADQAVTFVLFMLYSLPSFFVAVVMLQFFAKGTPFEWFPSSGFESLEKEKLTTIEYIKDVIWHITLPIFCMTYGSFAALSRYARTGLLDIIRADFIRTARAKGLPESIVIVKHAARNGMIPILTLLATMLPALIGGSVVIETVFGIPGMGSYIFGAIQARDYNIVMAVMLISSFLTLIGMLISDISYALIDPRITFD